MSRVGWSSRIPFRRHGSTWLVLDDLTNPTRCFGAVWRIPDLPHLWTTSVGGPGWNLNTRESAARYLIDFVGEWDAQTALVGDGDGADAEALPELRRRPARSHHSHRARRRSGPVSDGVVDEVRPVRLC